MNVFDVKKMEKLNTPTAYNAAFGRIHEHNTTQHDMNTTQHDMNS